MIEELGPTFIKVGQILSTRQDIIPAWAVRELKKLQDQVRPMPFETVRTILTEQLGAPPEEQFASFEAEPIASASIGQVHGATLPTGARRAGRTAYGKPFSDSDAASSPAPPELGRWRLR